MLAPKALHLWEGDSLRLAARENADSKSASCSSPLRQWKAHLQRRSRVKVGSGRRSRALAVVSSQGTGVVGNSKEGFVRVSDGGASQSCLDGTDVRVPFEENGDSGSEDFRDGMAGFGCGEPGVDDRFDGNGFRVMLRSPDSASDGWPESFSSSDYGHISDRYLDSGVQDVGSLVGVDDLGKKGRDPLKEEVASIERFARARAAGRELVKRRDEVDLGSEVEDGVYFEPKVGDFVIGTVASGNSGKLEVDIGAKKLAHMFRKDVMPLDVCNVREMSWELPEGDSIDGNGISGHTDGPRYVHDEEVLNLALEVSMPVERGSVFVMEVKGLTPTGIAVLSARSVARGYAWQRVRQLQEQNVILEVQITEWTSAGLISKIEGLRAFLPIYNLVNRPPESSTPGTVSYKEYVGQFLSVMIHSVDEMKSNLVVSEKKAWVAKNAYIGALVDGIVTDVQPYGVHLRIKDTDLSGVLHISNISRARIDDIGNLFTIGEEVRAMVVPSNIKRRISFCTADLEIEDGLILRDKEAVYQGAERIAAEIASAYKNRNFESEDSDDYVDSGEQEIVIANRDWLDFGDNTNLDWKLPL
ncbi:hypothetical protein KC19_6G100900 [Ceratodon purpureus]|uniref:S1 motif domain-containing protein n=1 Tax=Ceratodon purpureus TaxID=3225 RepID=A0A8T0HF44_CERPU|nr:hypothetical protein KC19_6G100900 [Ceratodon purpureus]